MPKEILGSLLNEQHSSRLCPTTKNICESSNCSEFTKSTEDCDLVKENKEFICPVTKEHCDDECCPSFATEEQCNLGPNSDLLTDTKPENNID